MHYLTNEDDFEYPQNGITFIYFYATWMPFHKKLTSMIQKMEEKYDNVYFLAIDIDFFKSLVIRFNIESIPTMLFFNNDKEVKRLNGVILTSVLKHNFYQVVDNKKK